MSAFLVSQTHIRALVTAAMWDKYHQIPPPPRELLERYPEAFKGLLSARDLHSSRSWWLCYEDEFGRALLLANHDSLTARYCEPAPDESELLRHRHAHVDLKPAAVINACDCYGYQACEVSDWDSCWANKAQNAIREAAIKQITRGEKWGIEDPPGGAPEPGTAGAPVSLMSLMKR